MQLVTLANN